MEAKQVAGSPRGSALVAAVRPALDALIELAATDGVELSEMAFLVGRGALPAAQQPACQPARRYREAGGAHVVRVDRGVFRTTRAPAFDPLPAAALARRIGDEIRAIEAGPDGGDAVLVVHAAPVFCVGPARVFGVQVARPMAPDGRARLLQTALAVHGAELAGVVLAEARARGCAPGDVLVRVTVLDPSGARGAVDPPPPGAAADFPLDVAVALRAHARLDAALPASVLALVAAAPLPGHAWFVVGGFQRLCVFELDLAAARVSVGAVGRA